MWSNSAANHIEFDVLFGGLLGGLSRMRAKWFMNVWWAQSWRQDGAVAVAPSIVPPPTARIDNKRSISLWIITWHLIYIILSMLIYTTRNFIFHFSFLNAPRCALPRPDDNQIRIGIWIRKLPFYFVVIPFAFRPKHNGKTRTSSRIQRWKINTKKLNKNQSAMERISWRSSRNTQSSESN